MKRLFIIQMLLWCAMVVVAQKQTFTIQGTIIDPSFNNEPLSGVNVYLKDRPGVGTASDIDGKFFIKASKGDMIVFTYLGYDNFEYQVAKEEKNLVVKMVTSSVQLEEAVVTAMGNKSVCLVLFQLLIQKICKCRLRRSITCWEVELPG